jgi:hypothetical protein
MRQLKEAINRVRIPGIVVGPVGREHQVVVAQLGHDVLRQLLLRLDRDEALAAEEVGGLRVLLEQRVVAPGLPSIVERPEPPREPAAVALEERRPEAREAGQHAARHHRAQRQHHLNRLSARVAQHEVVQIAAGQVLGVGGVVPVEGHRDVQLLRLGPQGVVVPVVEGPLVDHVGWEHQREGPQGLDGEVRTSH